MAKSIYPSLTMTTRSNLHYSVNAKSLQRSLDDALQNSCSIDNSCSFSHVSFQHSLSGCQYYFVPYIAHPIGAEIHPTQGMLKGSICTLVPNLFKLTESRWFTYTSVPHGSSSSANLSTFLVPI